LGHRATRGAFSAPRAWNFDMAMDPRLGWGSFLKAVLYNIEILAGPMVTLIYHLYSSIILYSSIKEK